MVWRGECSSEPFSGILATGVRIDGPMGEQMPFDPFRSRSFTTPSVRANAPAASGVYALTSSHEWIYIGQSDNILASLLSHLEASDSELMKKKPTGFVYEVCDPPMRSARQERLVIEYTPVCNQTRQMRTRISA